MQTTIDVNLSAELQELYLENKEWTSDIHFLEDEMRFFQNLFDKVLSAKVKRENIEKVVIINTSLNDILERRKQLKSVLDLRKQKLEQLLKGNQIYITLDLINEDVAIIKEIKLLLANDKLVKNELFEMIKDLKANETQIAIPVNFKSHRYPIL